MSRIPDSFQAAAARTALLAQVAAFASRPERESSLVATVSLPSPVLSLAPRSDELPLLKQVRDHILEVRAIAHEISAVYGARLDELARFFELHPVIDISPAEIRAIPNGCGKLSHSTGYRLCKDHCALSRITRHSPLRRPEPVRLAA
ncbi:hypothetical protein [Silvimonas sp.]|uniref:hypothetical protein n=1 Tax=Silvimonas sp. TaxID=2650811 RepID=UPI00283E598B|nr:hypothetical protein [Silvimonas sp.]MDR3429705.1 hypothetical protein [Silvimonas sp.]